MGPQASAALDVAEAQVAAVRDDPAARLALLVAVPTGGAFVHALAGAPRRAQRARRLAARQRVGGGRSTSGSSSTDASPWRWSVTLGASHPRGRYSSGWSSSRDRQGATGTALTTRASWAPTWRTEILQRKRASPR